MLRCFRWEGLETITNNHSNPHRHFCVVIDISGANEIVGCEKCKKVENKTRHIVVNRLIA